MKWPTRRLQLWHPESPGVRITVDARWPRWWRREFATHGEVIRVLGAIVLANRTPDVAPSGRVRGWHRGCPAAETPALGTYALVPDGDGGVRCDACGATDLVPNRSEETP